MGTNRALADLEFQKQLAFGQVAETRIARWIVARGGHVLPVYDIEYDTGKGPRLFGTSEYAAPDLLVFKNDGICWIEAKHKSVFSWYRKKQRWETGIDAHHYSQYRHVADVSGVPVWLLFLHTNRIPALRDRKQGCPEECPVGLFGNSLDRLDATKRFSDMWGRHGMNYWGVDDLRCLEALDDMPPDRQ